MSLERLLRDEAELLALSLLEERFEKMFVQVGDDRAINLNNVTQVFAGADADGRACIQVDFSCDQYQRFYPGKSGYAELQTWLSEQPTLLND